MVTCSHRTLDDHSYLTEHGRVWICSNCKTRERWGPSWTYYGNVECRQCGFARIDHVLCSEECQAEYAARTESVKSLG